MNWRRPLLFLALTPSGFLPAGCAAASDDATPTGSAMAAQPWEIDPYTTTEQIIVDGTLAGYLVTYDAIPGGMVIEREMPAGGRRILDLRFHDIGFVSPRGLFFRHVKGGVEELTYKDLRDGLGQFFGGSSRTRLTAFTVTPSKPAAAAAAEGDAPAEGDGAAMDDSEGGGG
ncbi:MAG: hypothetical protein EXS13_11260 [Planctomycetes bacterium]|nr:hypothetical protein [Planctomycetota bacterium]